uniref:MADS-box domain-containing protein n=1 Tax=Brassica oleracea var. oleracea TaxID=109376 RepID=A0A0D3CY32_BRAOL
MQSAKKPSSSLQNARAATVLKKALELSELCGVDVCIIWYDLEGNLVKTWPENEEAKVRTMAERYSMLSEARKATTSQELEDSLQARLQKIKEILHLDQPQETTLVSSSNDSSIINAYHHQASSLLSYPSSSSENCVDVSTTTTTTSMNHPQSKFSILLYNHENGEFTQLANSSALPSFEQQPQIPCNQDYGYLDLPLGEQGMRGCNNFDLSTLSTILPSPPLMQTQTPNFQQSQQAYDQITYFGRMLS